MLYSYHEHAKQHHPAHVACRLAFLDHLSKGRLNVCFGAGSVTADSFEDGLLDYPHYTRPREFQGQRVPEVLFSGHHEKIRRWRRERQVVETARRRPDLIGGAELTREERELAARVAGEQIEAEPGSET